MLTQKSKKAVNKNYAKLCSVDLSILKNEINEEINIGGKFRRF